MALTLQTWAAYGPSPMRPPFRPPPAQVEIFYNHLAALRQNAPPGFSIVVARPFIVLGDEPADVVQMRAEKTVKWAVDKLKQDYFTRDPDELIDVWLFKDDASYRTNALRLFGDTPTTPFGYYSARHHALVMNISTGGGTLVHEIVHPFMRANSRNAPRGSTKGWHRSTSSRRTKRPHPRPRQLALHRDLKRTSRLENSSPSGSSPP